ncbi:Leucine-rich repeat, immunoglobulin-like domain and transmembrane domain-containing protein 3 [Folsomia candida]|uniref:Leucine-rich repeat, immunoglobulin-like domain and transmembrane domain-containing protein 3 n=1 Tax=Folsomia candida TaxID=158441 RepID=A0A226E1T2_FOLCA|nr:Leucine-rich repeat, immunoglobulin-like domain and transmembrane domain-containing protein 3 [Folsomia candida]
MDAPGIEPHSPKNLFLLRNEEEDRNNLHVDEHPLPPSTTSGSRDGFEAEVQIQIGPNGGTISASRRRRETVELQQMNADLISAQDERKDKLHATLIAEKVELEELQKDILNLRSKLNPLFNDLEKLKDENQRLRIECQLMTREVDLYDNGTVPLGETNLEFYRDIYSGQDINALFGSTQSRRRRQGVEPGGQYVSRKPPPPRPPPPNPKHLPSPPREEGPNSEWHPDLVKCEQCDMQRVSRLPNATVGPSPPWIASPQQ